MTTLTLYKGRKGADGLDGINGLGPTDVNDYILENPILDCLQPNNFSKNAFLTWTRAQLATYQDRYGVYRFSEQTSYTNFVDYSEDFTQWNDLFNQWSIIGTMPDPLGGNDATEINLDSDTINPIGVGSVISRNENGWPIGGYVVVSFYIRRISGDISSLDIGVDSDVYQLGTLSDDWERKSVKVSSANGGFDLSINPRGLSGARVGLFGVQIEETLLNKYVRTNGTSLTVNGDFVYIHKEAENDHFIENKKHDFCSKTYNFREAQNGYLIESPKQNLCLNTQDFNDWTITGGEVSEYPLTDTFGFVYSKITPVFGSLATITLETDTEALTEGQEYTVSFYAFVSGGSITSLSCSLGSGDSVELNQPSVVGFERISTKAVAGPDNKLLITVISDALNAQLHIHAFQIEEGELSSYNESSTSGQSRDLDLISMDYEYNAIAPSLPWTVVFEINELPDDNRVKTVFSNGQVGSDEFSAYFQNQLLFVNNGGDTISFSLSSGKVAISYDGSTIRFYSEQRQVFTAPFSSTSFIAPTMYIGSNGIENAIDAYLSRCMFYNVELSSNDIEYLLGA